MMKVYFPGPMAETYHPRLGKLVRDKVFELPADQAGLYIAAGLLKKAPAPKTNKAGVSGGREE